MPRRAAASSKPAGASKPGGSKRRRGSTPIEIDSGNETEDGEAAIAAKKQEIFDA